MKFKDPNSFTSWSGDFWLPVGGLKKEDMHIPPVITILSMSLLPRKWVQKCCDTVLRSMRNGFCIYDTRGFDCGEMGGCLEELSTWMEDGVRHNQPCLRPGDEKLHKMALTSSFNGKYIKRTAVEALKTSSTAPHFEMPWDRISSRVKICEYLGISEITGSYDIACVTDQGILPEELDPVTAFSVTETIYRALIQADITHQPKSDIIQYLVRIFCCIMYWIGAFFAALARFFWNFTHKHKLNG
ncbi:hypothetical protein Leryth_026902 [Lithospermum erythrorhizon]|nr:hypothetical protein Leryth_026902 [Lithospermum erythrorhizon]